MTIEKDYWHTFSIVIDQFAYGLLRFSAFLALFTEDASVLHAQLFAREFFRHCENRLVSRCRGQCHPPSRELVALFFSVVHHSCESTSRVYYDKAFRADVMCPHHEWSRATSDTHIIAASTRLLHLILQRTLTEGT